MLSDCCSWPNMVLKNCKWIIEKLIVAYTDWIYFIFFIDNLMHVLVYLEADLTINLLEIWDEKLRNNIWGGMDNRVGEEHSLGQRDLGRAGMHGTEVGPWQSRLVEERLLEKSKRVTLLTRVVRLGLVIGQVFHVIPAGNIYSCLWGGIEAVGGLP